MNTSRNNTESVSDILCRAACKVALGIVFIFRFLSLTFVIFNFGILLIFDLFLFLIFLIKWCYYQLTNDNSHPVDPTDAEARLVYSYIRNEPTLTEDQPSAIIVKATQSYPHTTLASLPKTRSIARAIQIKLQDEIRAPRNVDNLTDLAIPAETVTYEGTSILQFYSGSGEERICRFGNPEYMHILRRVKPFLWMTAS